MRAGKWIWIVVVLALGYSHVCLAAERAEDKAAAAKTADTNDAGDDNLEVLPKDEITIDDPALFSKAVTMDVEPGKGDAADAWKTYGEYMQSRESLKTAIATLKSLGVETRLPSNSKKLPFSVGNRDTSPEGDLKRHVNKEVEEQRKIEATWNPRFGELYGKLPEDTDRIFLLKAQMPASPLRYKTLRMNRVEYRFRVRLAMSRWAEQQAKALAEQAEKPVAKPAKPETEVVKKPVAVKKTAVPAPVEAEKKDDAEVVAEEKAPEAEVVAAPEMAEEAAPVEVEQPAETEVKEAAERREAEPAIEETAVEPAAEEPAVEAAAEETAPVKEVEEEQPAVDPEVAVKEDVAEEPAAPVEALEAEAVAAPAVEAEPAITEAVEAPEENPAEDVPGEAVPEEAVKEDETVIPEVPPVEDLKVEEGAGNTEAVTEEALPVETIDAPEGVAVEEEAAPAVEAVTEEALPVEEIKVETQTE